MSDDDPTERGSDPDDRPTVRGLAAGRPVFGRYTLTAVVGRGGMGVVWRARDGRLERDVALKFLPEVIAGDVEAARDLRTETKRCLDLTHPNIVRVHDFVEEPPMAAIAMEYVAGQSLAVRKAGAPGGCLAVEELAPLVAQLCAALDYAHHTAKVVHRDIKPANILVTPEGMVKVTDFGIARSLTDTHTRLTGRVSGTSGTLLYMSPQQLLGGDPSAGDDIYALGATLYELLTGKPPFHTGDLPTQIRDVAPKPLNERRAALGLPPVPNAWEKTIQSCLAKDPAGRPQSAAVIAGRLGLAAVRPPLAGEPEAARIATDRPNARLGPSRPARRKGFKLPLLAGLAAIVLLATIGYLLWPRASPKPVTTKAAEPSLASGPTGGTAPSASRTVAQSAPPAPAPLPREFMVAVDPPDAGARLWLGPASDVAFTNGTAVVKDLADGDQDVVVQAPGYQPFTTRVTVKDGRGRVEAKLVPVRGNLTITARPGTVVTATDTRGRQIRLGTVPDSGALTTDNLLTVGTYSLRLEHPDCAPAEIKDVNLAGGRPATVTPPQTPLPGELRVFSVPAGAEVRVNGAAAGNTPATVRDQPSEKPLTIEGYLPGYRPVKLEVTLNPKETRNVNLGALSPERGSAALRFADPGRPSDGRITVKVDGEALVSEGVLQNDPNGNLSPYARLADSDSALLLDRLEVGSRTIEVTHPDYEPWREQVEVRDQQTTTVEVALKPKPGVVALKSGAHSAVNGGALDEAMLAAIAGAVVNRLADASAVPKKAQYPEEGQAWTVPDLNLVMQAIPAGTFTMGSPPNEAGRSHEEGPQTRVTLTRPFWLGRTEVTQAQWQALMGSNPSSFKGADRPVEQVSWDEAMEFCRRLTERERAADRLPAGYTYALPTEAQWEYACRAGTTGDYAGNLDSMAWYASNSSNQTHPVGQKQANSWGLYDMHGNVEEWCLDWYQDHLPGGSVTDPAGPPSGFPSRVLRGGSWFYVARLCRSAVRGWNMLGLKDNGVIGFRLALTFRP